MASVRSVALAFGMCAALSAVAAVPAAAQANCAGNSNALGIARTVQIDTTGGPAFGSDHYKMHDFLQPKEVVLTFDDGPWLNTTRQVLQALAAHCTRATFFTIGKHATYYPEVLREVAAAGHSIGTHTWSHTNLRQRNMTPEKAKEEIEKGFSAAKLALGTTGAPSSFFRFPALQDTPELLQYLGSRNLAVFSMDVDAFDFRFRQGDAVVKNVLGKLDKMGKGIVLLHDFQPHTAAVTMELLNQLKAKGYKIVHMRSKAPATTLEQYDEMTKAEFKGMVGSARPTSSVVTTVPNN